MGVAVGHTEGGGVDGAIDVGHEKVVPRIQGSLGRTQPLADTTERQGREIEDISHRHLGRKRERKEAGGEGVVYDHVHVLTVLTVDSQVVQHHPELPCLFRRVTQETRIGGDVIDVALVVDLQVLHAILEHGGA